MSSGLRLAGVAAALMLGLVISPTNADACETALTCDSSHEGETLEGAYDVEYHSGTDCLASWKCDYTGGYTVTHIVPHQTRHSIEQFILSLLSDALRPTSSQTRRWRSI